MNDWKETGQVFPKQMRQVFGPDIHKGLAEKLFPDGSTIRCKQCQVERHCTTQEIETWLRDGYPKCKRCGKATEIDNPYVRRMEYD